MMHTIRSIEMQNFFSKTMCCYAISYLLWDTYLHVSIKVIHDIHTVQMEIFYWMFSCTAIFLFCYTVISKYSSIGILVYITV